MVFEATAAGRNTTLIVNQPTARLDVLLCVNEANFSPNPHTVDSNVEFLAYTYQTRVYLEPN